MKKALAGLALAACTVIAAGGCGGGGQSGGAPPMSGPPPGVDGEAQGGRVVINIVNLEFQPPEAEVPAGATVVFTNSDQVSHTVTKEKGPGPVFDSGAIEPGGTFSQVFKTKGRYEIVDSQRPETSLKLTVVK